MAIQLQQALEVGKYLVTQRLMGRKQSVRVLLGTKIFIYCQIEGDRLLCHSLYLSQNLI